jgi:hypothetical protein
MKLRFQISRSNLLVAIVGMALWFGIWTGHHQLEQYLPEEPFVMIAYVFALWLIIFGLPFVVLGALFGRIKLGMAVGGVVVAIALALDAAQ